MIRSKFLPVITIAALCVLAGGASAQSVSSLSSGAQKSAGSSAEAAVVMLRVQLVISRFEGEKKVGSLPYTFLVSTASGPPGTARIRMGAEVPVSASPGNGKDGAVQYRGIGTNIDCSDVRDLQDGRYRLSITVENSAVISGADAGRSAPLFRNFNSTFTPVLRDGQSSQTIASTDPATGDVVKIDVTLNVVR